MESVRRKHARLGIPEWRRIIQQFAGSEMAPGAFCRQEGLCERTFRRWRVRLGKAGPPFVELVPRAVAEPDPPVASVVTWTLEVELPTGVTIRYRG